MHTESRELCLEDLIYLTSNEVKISTLLSVNGGAKSVSDIHDHLSDNTKEWIPDTKSIRETCYELMVFEIFNENDTGSTKRGESKFNYSPNSNRGISKIVANAMLTESVSNNYSLHSFFGIRNTSNWSDSVPIRRAKAMVGLYAESSTELDKEEKEYLTNWAKLPEKALRTQKKKLADAGFLKEKDNSQTYKIVNLDFSHRKMIGNTERKVIDYISEKNLQLVSNYDIQNGVEELKTGTVQRMLTKWESEGLIKKEGIRTKQYELMDHTKSLAENVLIPLIGFYRGKRFNGFELETRETPKHEKDEMISAGLQLYAAANTKTKTSQVFPIQEV